MIAPLFLLAAAASIEPSPRTGRVTFEIVASVTIIAPEKIDFEALKPRAARERNGKNVRVRGKTTLIEYD